MPKRSSIKGKEKPKRDDLIIPAREITVSVFAKNPAAVALGRLGGLKGGKARAEKLSARKRKQIAKRAAQARWGTKASE